MNWALKRQIIFLAIFLLFISVFSFYFIYPFFQKAPSCLDGKQNGDELGVDCGGSCLNLCLNQVDQLSVLWARSFKVVDGRYNAVAYIENHNKNSAIEKINYRFRFADKNNIYIGKREGSTTVPPSGKFAIFEPAIDIGNSIPVYTTFEFTEIPTWKSVPLDKIQQLNIGISGIVFSGENDKPALSAIVKNNSIFNIPEVSLVAILYDENHNAISTSRTYIEDFNREEEKEVNFTWQEAFNSKIVSKEIIPIYNIFSVNIK